MTPEMLQSLLHLPTFPATAAELVRVAGIDAAASLISAWPGQRFPVPVRVGGANPEGQINWERLVEIVGGAAATAIVRHWGGGDLYVPSCADSRRTLDHDGIRREYDELTRGGNYSGRGAVFEIALRHGLTSRAIEKILKLPDSPPPPGAGKQLGLFSA
ncbi:MAG: hypothetical protein LBP58_03060 [Azoarcus sp.]|jgi:hypothetical protein|nr:hypothetical protein [Azoarcus sp.]